MAPYRFASAWVDFIGNSPKNIEVCEIEKRINSIIYEIQAKTKKSTVTKNLNPS